MRITVKEVAEAAEVSVGTVSRVLNHDQSVSTENAARVNDAVAKLNYRPLRTRTRKSPERTLSGPRVALVLIGMDRSLATLPVVAQTVHGVESALAAAGANVSFSDIPDINSPPMALLQSEFDGLIIKGALQGRLIGETRNPLMNKLRNIPTVWLLGRPEGCWGDSVTADDIEVGRLAADHLVSQGHSKLAFLNPKADHTVFKRREMAFMWRAQELGATVTTAIGDHPEQWSLPLQATKDVAMVQTLVDRLLDQRDPPTAIFAPADSITTLVFRALATRRVSVPDQVSVISCNNERTLCEGLYPSLTTIDTHAELIGQRALDLLMWRIAGPRHEPDVTICVQPALVQRESIANLTLIKTRKK